MYETWLQTNHTLLHRVFESNNPPVTSSTGTELSNTNTNVPITMCRPTHAPNANDTIKRVCFKYDNDAQDSSIANGCSKGKGKGVNLMLALLESYSMLVQ